MSAQALNYHRPGADSADFVLLSGGLAPRRPQRAVKILIHLTKETDATFGQPGRGTRKETGRRSSGATGTLWEQEEGWRLRIHLPFSWVLHEFFCTLSLFALS